ncbi:phage tail terminator-like protein [Undibacterium sp. SXout7W]|uniref:phage tail terminator-like protein n=1 Tax=Undibacterium sp. SXout7W TaxID=3413049 RepID=UPI003BF23638
MSIIKIRAALETALAAIDPTFATAYENSPYTPVNNTPYQRVYLMLATPDNPTMGGSFFREVGIFQINLFYPLQGGTAATAARVDAIRTAFKRGNSFIKDDHIITIDRTPEVPQGIVDIDRWMQPIKIRFYSNMMS